MSHSKRHTPTDELTAPDAKLRREGQKQAIVRALDGRQLSIDDLAAEVGIDVRLAKLLVDEMPAVVRTYRLASGSTYELAAPQVRQVSP